MRFSDEGPYLRVDTAAAVAAHCQASLLGPRYRPNEQLDGCRHDQTIQQSISRMSLSYEPGEDAP